MTSPREHAREQRLKKLVHDVNEANATARVVAAKAILGEVRFVESLLERRHHRRSKVEPERRGI